MALELALRFNPGDQDRLFDAAFAQDKAGLWPLALSNYLTLLELNENNASVLNNLGVIAGSLRVTGKETDFFHRAAEHGNTLAAANLASMMIDASLFTSARQILNTARLVENPDDRVATTLSQLNDAVEKDDEKWKDFESRAAALRRQMHVYGEAALVAFPNSDTAFAGEWRTQSGQAFNAMARNGLLMAEWTEPVGALPTGSKTVEIFGRIKNRSATFKYQSKQADSPQGSASLLSLGQINEEHDCCSYLSTDLQEWTVFATEHSSTLVRKFTRATR